MANIVADAIDLPWNNEDIPDSDMLYYRVHKQNLRDGEPIPGAFRDREGGMSTDWDKYSSPQETLVRANNPKDNAIISLSVADVRLIPGQIVEHSPLIENRAHTDVIGDKKSDPEVRVKFGRASKTVIPWEE